MGIRFRKSFKVAPGVKVNLNKKSTSVTFGGKGAHYTVNSKGNTTKSVGIPGTGLYYTETSSRKTKSKRSEGKNEMAKSNKKKTGCLIPIIIFILFFILLNFIPSDKELTSVNISADTDTIYDITEPIPISVESVPSDINIPDDSYKSTGGSFDFTDGNVVFSSSTPGSYELWIENGDVTSNTLTLSIEDKSTAEQAAEQATAEQATTEQAAEQIQQPQEEMVWIPQSGSKYHSNSSCSGMTNPTQVTLSEAQSMGYEPCKKCY